MKEIKIQLKPFFELLKQNEQSMWDIFERLLTNEPQKILFLNENNDIEFEYILPNNLIQLKKDQQKFAEAFKSKLDQL